MTPASGTCEDGNGGTEGLEWRSFELAPFNAN